jgi:hypothetical protein
VSHAGKFFISLAV